MSSDNKNTILIVEDVSNIRDLLDVTLKFKGYKVQTAGNGHEALATISKERPALIISDILMPKMDGFSLVQRLRVDKETRHIPVILISATYVSAEDRDFALRLGAIRFLEKPVDTDVFLEAVENSLAADVQELPDPLDDSAFYKGYVDRLEMKLAQKDDQIARTQRLITSLGAEQKPAFEQILEEEMHFRNFILQELRTVKARVRASDSQDIS